MTYIGIAAMFLGVLIFCVGWGASPKNKKLLGIGALMMFGGMFIGIGGNPARDMPNGSPAMVLFGFLMAIIGIVLLVSQIRGENKAVKERNKKILESSKITFYKECVNLGIKTCSGEKNTQKAALIAQKYKLAFTDIAALFEEGKRLAEQENADKKRDALEKQKDEEKNLSDKLNKYSSLSGRDKRIAMLSEERSSALASAQSLRSGASALYNATQQKELDWATHGGIASGIAGPAAGIATAMNIQAKNAEIRAQNQANLQAFAPVFTTSYSGAASHEKRAAELLEEIENTRTKLVSSDSATDCLKHLLFTEPTVNVSETGTCTVEVKAELSKPMIIFDDVNAVIDGTVIAKIYDGSELIGTAALVLPKYGIGSKTTLKGMCLFCGKPGKEYRLEYAAANLWAMER